MAFLLFVFLATFVNAQSRTSDLAINKVFEKYGKSTSSSMVVIDAKNDSDSQFRYYKSISIEDNQAAVILTKKYLEKDKKISKNVKEVYSEGQLSMVFLTLKEQKDGYYRFILFTGTKDEMTLIYLELEDEKLLNTVLQKK